MPHFIHTFDIGPAYSNLEGSLGSGGNNLSWDALCWEDLSAPLWSATTGRAAGPQHLHQAVPDAASLLSYAAAGNLYYW